jgi:hypothetical protein
MRRMFAPVALALVVADPAAVRAAFVLTAEAPGVQSSQVSGVTTETFSGVATGTYASGLSTAVGTLNSARVLPADVFGGAGRAGNYFTPNGVSTLTLAAPAAYFGFWMSAADGSNLIEFFSGGSLVAFFRPLTTLALLTDPAYLGNPNAPGGNNNERYAYLNVIGTGGSTFDQIRFTSSLFEADNFSVRTTAPSPLPGTVVQNGIQSVPAPPSLLLGGVGALMTLGYGWRRRVRVA